MTNLNIQSLRNKIEIFSDFLHEQKVDIAALSEHWLSQDMIERIYIPGYNIAGKFCRTSSCHGGAAIIVRDDLQYKELLDLSRLAVEKVTEIAAVRFPKLRLTLIQIYRPPSSDIDYFFSVLNEVLENCYNNYSEDRIIFSGDFNIDLIKPSRDRNKLMSIFETFNMKYIFELPSRENSCSSTCIDNMFTNVSKEVCQHVTCEPHLSDHRAQILKIPEIGESEKQNEYRIVRPINGKNTHRFIRSVMAVDWEHLHSDDAEVYFGNFHEEIMKIYERSFLKNKWS